MTVGERQYWFQTVSKKSGARSGYHLYRGTYLRPIEQYDRKTKDWIPVVVAVQLTACGQVLYNEPKFAEPETRGSKCRDCSGIFMVLSKATDITADVLADYLGG